MTKKNSITIADKVFEQLCSEIIHGEIEAGSKISEPDLSLRLKVSRASLREAIGRLEACNLVTRKANIGARVISLSQASLLEIYHVREALEGMAARQAAESATNEEIKKLQNLNIQHEHELKENKKSDAASYFQQSGDLDFHYHIVQSSHNSHLINLLCNDLYHLMRMYRFQFGRVSQRIIPALDEHRHVLNAIIDRDSEMAELLMRNHIRKSRRHIETMMINK